MTINSEIVLHGNLVLPDRVIPNGELIISGDMILEVNEHPTSHAATEVFSKGYLFPGLVDLHTHGIAGHDVMDAQPDTYQEMDAHLAQVGCTRYLATTMSATSLELEQTFNAVKQYRQSASNSGMMGVHMEGPYIHPEKVGAQRPQAVRLPSVEELRHIRQISGDLVQRITLAPELPGAAALIAYCLNEGIEPSLGHSNASYEEAETAFQRGVTQVTHLFNAMTGLNHRAPGLVGAALLNADVMVEMIVDGVHLDCQVVRLVERIKTSQKVLLVTDAMRATLLPDGVYDLGGQSMQVNGGVARTASGNLAGSTLTLMDALFRYQRFTGVPLYEAVTAASLVPAQAMKWSRHGALLPGFVADVLWVDPAGHSRVTYRQGDMIYDGR